MIVIKDLDVCYGKKQIIFGVSIEIAKGERLLLAGPNGAGKSTLLQAIAGMVPAKNGTIRRDGVDITTSSTANRVYQGMGYLLQTGNIVPSLTVHENFFLSGFSRSRALLVDRVGELLKVFPFLEKRLDVRSGLLSGGERQALAICMVLMKKPRILLLDEPSAGLAPKAAEEILTAVGLAQEQFGIETVCMVEHRLKESLPWASRLVVMAGGRVVHIDNVPESIVEDSKGLERFYF